MAVYLSERESQALERKFNWVLVIALASLSLLLLRFWQLQILEGRKWKKIAEDNQIRYFPVLAERGLLRDREGRILVQNRHSFNISVIPADLNEETILQLAAFLDTTPEELHQTLAQKPRWSPFVPVLVRQDITRDQLARVEEHMRFLSGVHIEVNPLRDYPQGTIAAHVVGYLSEIDDQELGQPDFSGYQMGDMLGREGLERQKEKLLRGRDGLDCKTVNAQGKKENDDCGQFDIADRPPVRGQTVELTLDANLQRLAADFFQGKDGAAVVLQIHTGEVLALYSAPAYDLQAFVGKTPHEVWSALKSDPRKSLLNRAIAGQYPPGSVFKLILAAAGLEEGVITPSTRLACSGNYPFGNHVFHCWKKHGHGRLTVEQAIVQSCDIFFYQVGQRLGIDRIAKYANRFGLGLPTEIELFGEKTGLIPTTQWKKKALGVEWFPGETLSCAIGQGYVLVTPLQAALIPAFLGNGGNVFRPQLGRRVLNVDGKVVKEFEPERLSSTPLSPATRELMLKAITGAVNDSRGTAYWSARSDKVRIAGKTGTAQVTRLDRFQDLPSDQVPPEFRDHAWFVALAPADAPEIAVAVLVEHGGHGSSAAAPLAKILIESYFAHREKTAGAAPAGKS